MQDEIQDRNGSQAGSVPFPPRTYDSAGDFTPYLGLRARLSQIWFNRWTVLLLLVLVRVVILVSGLNGDITNAQEQALAACTKVEDIGSAMASMPHYLSVGVNDLAADGISKTVQGMVELLGFILTGVEQLILFVINFYIGTYACLSSALIHGGLDVGIGAADETSKLMNDVIGDITTTIQKEASSVQDAINSAFSGISSASSIFGKTLNPPTINLTGPINDLKNIHIDDTSFVKSLQKLNTTIPTYDQAENFTQKAISIPFNAVRTVLNNTYGGYRFDTSVFPVAKKQALTFCSGNDIISSFFEDLFTIADRAKITFIVVIVILALLACIPMAWLEIRRFRSEQRRARLLTQNGYDPMDVVYIASRPHTAAAGIKIASHTGSAKRQLLVRWAIAYATSLPALFVLSLALAGYVSCICQAILLHAVEVETPILTSEVGNFADNVVTSLEAVSMEWAKDANGVLLGFQNQVNDDVLSYVTNATTAVNNTLNVFMHEVTTGINDVFNGTVLDNTIQQIVRCLIGIKVEAIEEGLTWVHDHAHVTLPLFPNNTFSDGAAKSISNDSSLTNFLSNPGSVTSDDITAAVDKIVTFLKNNLIQEALISTGLLLVFIIVVLLGVVRAMHGMILTSRTRGDGGQRFYPTTSDLSTAQKPIDVGSNHIDTSLKPFFPRFDGTSGSTSADDYTEKPIRNEKLATANAERVANRCDRNNERQIICEQKGYWLTSRYGDVVDAGGR